MATEKNIVEHGKPVENIVWESYDRPIKAMRRTQLWRLADLHGIKYPRGASKDIMLRLVDHWEITHGEGMALKPPAHMSEQTFLQAIAGPETRYDEVRDNPATGQTNVGSFVDAIEGITHFETAPKEDEEALPNSMPELKRLAKERGVKQNPSMKRDELQAAIRGKDTP